MNIETLRGLFHKMLYRFVKRAYNNAVSLLQEGSKVGLMRTADGQLHIFLDGRLKAKCKLNVPSNVYAVVDLFGKGCQATITGKCRVAERRDQIKIIQTSQPVGLVDTHTHTVPLT